MKVKIAYLPEEQRSAMAVAVAVRETLGEVKCHLSDRHPPFKHIYLSSNISPKPHNNAKND